MSKLPKILLQALPLVSRKVRYGTLGTMGGVVAAGVTGLPQMIATTLAKGLVAYLTAKDLLFGLDPAELTADIQSALVLAILAVASALGQLWVGYQAKESPSAVRKMTFVEET